ncbi:hypothetical protein BN946_scf184470.g30 [Trametes cinnabarina]|uniref:Uncharacterized protein n=1 Tax=Pycnoporus cinnabarinus TaxID=5643 RepID=A0A060SP11_PYCCI|nr:hypothetical protein BN946_scf184470.g30 [Trametes cinnabarina]
MVVVPKLPVAIVHNIFTQLREDPDWFPCREAILACTYVCRDWRDTAHAILFRSVKLYSHQRYDLFRDLVVSTPRIAAYVRSLKIIGSWCEDLYPLPPFLLLEILEVLPNIRHVGLHSITLLGWPAYNALPPEPFRLRGKLVIESTQNGPYFNQHCLRLDLLRLFTDVDHLVLLENVNDDDVIGRMTANRRGIPPPVVRKLTFGGPDCYLDYNYQCGGLDTAHLQSIDVEVTNRAEARHAGKILRKYGPNLRELELSLCEAVVKDRSKRGPKGAPLPTLLELGVLARIERMILRIHHTRWPELKSTLNELARLFCGAYSAALAAVPSGTLRELTFIFVMPHTAEEFASAAVHFAPLIVQAVERFPKLEKILLVVARTLTSEQCNAALRKVMPETVADRGLIRYDHWNGKWAKIDDDD